MGILYYRLRRKKIIALFKKYLRKERPAAIISVIPIINYEILQAAKQLNIPFLVFSAALDPSIYLNGIKNPDYHKFYLGLPFYDDELDVILSEHEVPESQVLITGYPLRPEFTQPKNQALLRKKFNIPENKPVILVLLESLGTETLPAVTKQIYQLSTPAHILICVGKAEHLKEKIEQIPVPSHMSVEILGFTDAIADLMAVADLFVTKSGSVSVAEALYMNLPMLLDATSEILVWEQFNHQFLKKHHWGNSITDLQEITHEITMLLLDRRNLELMSNNINNLEKKHGGDAIKQIIDQLTAGRSSKIPVMVHLS
jgi:UDP-N-acetylglucosamine:LPS N-acetylglucosamine transferase